jgi:hypothetical protein
MGDDLVPRGIDGIIAMFVELSGILYPDHVKNVWKAFPRQHKANLVNGMKRFLHDQHYFTRPVKLERLASDEVRDPLMIPELIDRLLPTELRFSRLIAVAIVRLSASRRVEIISGA